MELGHALTEIREKRQIPTRLAAIGIGISQRYLQLIEKGEKMPSFGILWLLSNFYEVPMWVLFAYIDEGMIQPPKEKRKAYKEFKVAANKIIKELI